MMSFINKAALIISICFFVATPSIGQKAKKQKCKLEPWIGSWYGTYETSGDPYYILFTFEQIDNCQVTGFVHWPQYFNTKLGFKGNQGDSLILLESTTLRQGHNLASNPKFELSLKADTIIGRSLSDDESTYDIKMTRATSLSEEDKVYFQDLMSESSTKFGTASIISENHDITLEEILEAHLQNPVDMDSSAFQTMEISGEVTYSGIAIPISIAIKHPNKMRLDMSLMNKSYIVSSDDVQSWEYNGFEDKVTVEEVTEGESGNERFVFNYASFAQDVEKGYRATKIENAKLDSLDAYKISLQKDSDKLVYFVDKKSHLVIRNDTEEKANYYFNYKKFGGYLIPTLMYDIDASEANKYTFNNIIFNTEISDAFFEIPDSLKRRIVRTNERDADYYDQLGIKQIEEKQYKNAIESYGEAINLDPNQAYYYYQRGVARSGEGDYYEAISDFSRSVEKDPDYASAFNRRGLCKYYLEDYKNALPDFDLAIKFDSAMEATYTNRAYCHGKLGDYEAALKDLTQLTKLDSTNGQYYQLQGVVFAQLKKYEEAIASYGSALSLGYEEDGTHNYMGVSLYALEKYEEAKLNFEKAVSKDSTDFQMLQNLGNVHTELGDYKNAVTAFEKAIALSPDKHDLYNDLGLVYYYWELPNESISNFDHAIKLNNQDASYFDNRALAKTLKQDFTGAIQDYSTSIDLYPQDANIYYQRGLLKALINDQFDACRDFKTASDMDHEEAGKELEKCITVKNDQTDN